MLITRRSGTCGGGREEAAHEHQRRHQVHREVALDVGGLGALERRHGSTMPALLMSTALS
jgi:hypothetical protein